MGYPHTLPPVKTHIAAVAYSGLIIAAICMLSLGFELYEWQRLYIITGIWQPPEGRLHGRTTAYILRLLLDQSKPLLLYEFSQVAAYADNPFMERQYQPVPMQYAGWFRHEIRSIYEQLRVAGVPVREMITEQQRVISW